MIIHSDDIQSKIMLMNIPYSNYFYYDKIEGVGPYFMVCAYYLKRAVSPGYTPKKCVLDIANSRIYDLGTGEGYIFSGTEMVYMYDAINIDIDNINRNYSYKTDWDTYTTGNVLFIDGYMYFSADHAFNNIDTGFVISTQQNSETGGFCYVLKGSESESGDDPEHNPADYVKNYKIPTSVYQYTDGNITLIR